jgi:hypothetical protein
VLGGGLATRGYACHPKRGRLVTYPGDVLHGVIPGVRGGGDGAEAPRCRLTLVVTWWRGSTAPHPATDACAPTVADGVSARMPWPEDSPAWTHVLARRDEGWGERLPTTEEVTPVCCSPVWYVPHSTNTRRRL